MPRAIHLLSDASGIDLDSTTLRYVFTPDANEKFIGYGQKRLALQDTFQLAGRTERRNYGEEGYPGRGSQGVLIVPFYISSKGYGFYANTTFPHEGRFNNAGDYSFRVEVNNLATTEADYFFIYGPTAGGDSGSLHRADRTAAHAAQGDLRPAPFRSRSAYPGLSESE